MYKDSLDKQASWRFLMYVFLFILPIFFAQMEVEACIHLKCAESVVQREIVPMIIIVFSNKGGTDKILSVIVDNACANQKVEIEFTVPLFSFVGFRIYVGSLVGNGGGERDTSQAITRKYPVVGITETDIGIGVFDFCLLYTSPSPRDTR